MQKGASWWLFLRKIWKKKKKYLLTFNCRSSWRVPPSSSGCCCCCCSCSLTASTSRPCKRVNGCVRRRSATCSAVCSQLCAHHFCDPPHCVCLPVHFTCTGRMVRGFCFHGRCVRNTKVNKGPRWRSVTGGATCVYLCVWKYFAVPLNSILINSDESIKRSYSLYCLFQWVFTWYKQLF